MFQRVGKNFISSGIVRHYSKRINACIIGSGPSGFYSAKYLLLNKDFDTHISMIEQVPTPFGLVRFGVAPDHPNVKLVSNDFKKVAGDPRFSYYGNVVVGKDVSVSALREIFDVVIFTSGSQTESKLGLKGEDLYGVESGKDFVGWYNGLPPVLPEEAWKLEGKRYVDLINRKDTAMVIGQGNVALDVARFCARPYETMTSYEFSERALKVREKIKFKKVYIVGRRGPIQIAATIKELRELDAIDHICVMANPNIVNLTEVEKKDLERVGKPGQKIYDQVKKFAENKPKPNDTIVQFEFCKSPIEFIGNKEVEKVKLEKTKLVEKNGQVKAESTGEFDFIETGIVFRSIGYRSLPIPEVPFDDRNGIILNKQGRILSATNKDQFEKGMYCAGWTKRGPSGVVGTNINCAKETVKFVLEDTEKDKDSLKQVDSDQLLAQVLKKNNINYINWEEFLKIDNYEEEEGKKIGRIRRKLLSVEEMLKVAKQ